MTVSPEYAHKWSEHATEASCNAKLYINVAHSTPLQDGDTDTVTVIKERLIKRGEEWYKGSSYPLSSN